MNIIINPGTESLTTHSEKNAIIIAQTICKDLEIPEKHFKRNPERDNDGYYGFVFMGKGGKIDVDIPGINPETVIKGKPFESPRLYVDGSSWLYGYALDFIYDGIKKEIV